MAQILQFTRQRTIASARISAPGERIWLRTETSDLDQSAKFDADDHFTMEWKPIVGAPFNCDLELSVRDYDGHHALVFPCRRILDGWINAETSTRIDVRPTHWREWRGED